MNERILIFGAGGFGREILHEIRNDKDVIGFLDNDKKRYGTYVDGVEILGGIEVLHSISYDKIIWGTMSEAIIKQLLDNGVPESRIVRDYITVKIRARTNFLFDYAKFLKGTVEGAVAEGGVFQGDFSKELNRAFPDKELYLFDTFDGFDNRDICYDREKGYSSVSEKHYFQKTSEQIVLEKLPYPERAHVLKGYFPDTTKLLDANTKFLFVNLDFDLYAPTFEGLKYFYPRLVERGVILIHDYYHMNFKAVPQAINDYQILCGEKLFMFPIGDHCSIAIIKK